MVISNLRSKLPPLGTLAAFEAACRHHSFTRAASELNLTQAAISRQILSLEEYLGVRLFERMRHNVAMTAAGARFADQVNPALLAISAAAVSLKSQKNERLTIRSEFCLATHWLMPRLSRFQAANPSLTLKVLTSNQPAETGGEQYDIALGYGISKTAAIVSHPLAVDVIVPVCSPEIRAKLSSPCMPKDLASCDLIHCEQIGDDSIDWRGYLAAFDVGLSLEPHFILSTYTSVIDAAVQGYGVALGWRYTVDDLLRKGRLVEVEGFTISSQSPLAVHIRSERLTSRAVKDFLKWIELEIGVPNAGDVKLPAI